MQPYTLIYQLEQLQIGTFCIDHIGDGWNKIVFVFFNVYGGGRWRAQQLLEYKLTWRAALAKQGEVLTVIYKLLRILAASGHARVAKKLVALRCRSLASRQ